jgi:hypothetical protein
VSGFAEEYYKALTAEQLKFGTDLLTDQFEKERYILFATAQKMMEQDIEQRLPDIKEQLEADPPQHVLLETRTYRADNGYVSTDVFELGSGESAARIVIANSHMPHTPMTDRKHGDPAIELDDAHSPYIEFKLTAGIVQGRVITRDTMDRIVKKAEANQYDNGWQCLEKAAEAQYNSDLAQARTALLESQSVFNAGAHRYPTPDHPNILGSGAGTGAGGPPWTGNVNNDNSGWMIWGASQDSQGGESGSTGGKRMDGTSFFSGKAKIDNSGNVTPPASIGLMK